MKYLFPLLVSLALVGCPTTTTTQDPATPTPIKPPYTDLCDEMCDHIGPENLKCEEGEDVYNDDLPGDAGVPNQSCEDFCRTLQEQGVNVNPRCVRLVPNCGSIEDYRQKEPESCNLADGGT